MQIRVVLDKLEYVKPEVATLVFYFIVTVRRVLFNFHRFAMRGTRRIAAALTICALCVLRESVASLPSRCDGVRYIYAWGTCLECSLNALPGLSVCPSNYNKITTGQGIRRCSFRLHFGADFGYIIVPGCQHRCARTVVQKECCDGFWGSDCQGGVFVVSYNLIKILFSRVLTELTLRVIYRAALRISNKSKYRNTD